MNGLILFFLVIGIYSMIVFALHKKGILKKHNISFYGPFLMWRTEKGKELIDRIARRFPGFFRIYGRISLWLCVSIMFLMTLLLLWQATLALKIEAKYAPSPILMVGIPGVNPLIPIWYGIAALAVAIVVHEFAHGIQARLSDLNILSLGILWCVVPMGAFVEPDEEKIMEMPKVKRQHMFAVGPATNIFVALICVLIFSWGFMAAIEPKEDGMLIISVVDEKKDGITAPADEIRLEPGMVIVSVNGMNMSDSEDFTDFLESTHPGDNVTLTIFDVSKPEGKRFITHRNVTLVSRYSFTELKTDRDHREYLFKLDGSHRELLKDGPVNETLEVAFHDHDLYLANETRIIAMDDGLHWKLEDGMRKYEIIDDGTWLNVYEKDYGYLGVGSRSAQGFADELAHPYADDGMNVRKILGSTLFFVAMPFFKLTPFPDAITDNYEVNGVLSILPEPLFWICANLLFWLFWLNLMVGITNALPATPLDGGFIFRDGFDSFVGKIKKGISVERREEIVAKYSRFAAYMILFLILWQLIAPHLTG